MCGIASKKCRTDLQKEDEIAMNVRSKTYSYIKKGMAAVCCLLLALAVLVPVTGIPAAAEENAGIRVDVDARNEKIGKKIREATLEKVNYMLVIGDRDIEAHSVSVRTRGGEDLGAMSPEDFIAKAVREIRDKIR